MPRSSSDVPDFSGVAASYGASRPGYPAGLFDWLASVVSGRGVAWDSATGSGQAALGLVAHFDRVIGTDRSAAQIANATRHPRVRYHVAHAEASGLASSSVDLVVAAAALHWFDLAAFYREVQRVVRHGGVLAVWTYHVAHVEPPFDEVLWPFYRDVVGRYFMAGAKLVDDRYETIDLPGQRIESPVFVMSARWTASQILAFVRTWSGVQSYIEATGKDPVAPLKPQVESVCGSRRSVEVRWPVYLRAARL